MRIGRGGLSREVLEQVVSTQDEGAAEASRGFDTLRPRRRGMICIH